MLSSLLVALASGVALTAVGAQTVQRLNALGDRIQEPFSNITSVRELGADRTLVTDPGEQRLVLIDWTSNRTEQIGRLGDGPGEYRSPRQVIPLGTDSSLLVDTQLRRVSLVVGAGRPEPLRAEMGLRLTRFDSPYRGIDRGGRVLAFSSIPNRTPGLVPAALQRPSESDSVIVVAARLHSARVDTIARIRGRFRGRTETGRTIGGRRWVFELVNPYGVEDQAWLFQDGWIAVVRADPYGIEWIPPDGRARVRATLPHAPVTVTHRDREYAVKKDWSHVKAPSLIPDEFVGWPTTIPPFPIGALFPLPDGRLAIARTVTWRSEMQEYDIVDRTGAVSARLAVPLDTRVIGFGRDWVYVVTKDADDVETLSRHRRGF